MPPSILPDTIDDTAFLAELENFDGMRPADAGAPVVFPDRIDVLDRAFPLAVPGGSAPRLDRGLDLAGLDLGPRAETLSSAEPEQDARRSTPRNAAPALAVARVFVMGVAAWTNTHR
jgi:hypothetical protein